MSTNLIVGNFITQPLPPLRQRIVVAGIQVSHPL